MNWTMFLSMFAACVAYDLVKWAVRAFIRVNSNADGDYASG